MRWIVTIFDCGGFEIWQMAIMGVIWEVFRGRLWGLIFSYFRGSSLGAIIRGHFGGTLTLSDESIPAIIEALYLT